MKSSSGQTSRFSQKLARCAVLLALPLLLAGCVSTFQEVQPLTTGKPPSTGTTNLVLTPIQISDSRPTDTEKQVYQMKFRQGVEAWLAKSNVVQSVTVGAPTNVPPGSLVLGGVVNEVEKGSASARFWVGMGAGQARIQGEFEIKDAAGATLTRFTARRSYLGGSGIGGATMLSMDELFFRLGETVAESTSRWLKGKPLQ